MRWTALAVVMVLASCVASYAGSAGISVGVTMPSIQINVPLPPGVVIVPERERDYWFWDDHRGQWFYYDTQRRQHYSKRHAYRDDGRHFYQQEGQWRPRHEDRGKHKGWDKQEKHRDNDRDNDRDKHERGHDRHDRN